MLHVLQVALSVAAAVPTGNTTCSSWYSYRSTGDYSRCVVCPDGSLSVEDRCVQCNAAAPNIPFVLPQSNVTCGCPSGFQGIADISGASLPSVMCYEEVQCPIGMSFISDTAGRLVCACREGYSLTGTRCTAVYEKESTVQLGGLLTTSTLIESGINDATAKCTSRGLCPELLAWCAFQQHDPQLSACSTLTALSRAESPWVYPVYPFTVTLNPANTLPLYVMKWNEQGAYLGVFKLADYFLPCDTPLTTFTHTLKSGVQGGASCLLDPAAFVNHTTLTFELFLAGGEGLDSLFPIPVSIGGVLHKRFYTIDTASAAGYVRYASDLSFEVEVDSNGSILHPVLVLEFDAVGVSEGKRRVHIDGLWKGATQETSQALIGVCVVLAALSLLLSLLKCLAFTRRRQESPPAGSLHVTGDIEAAGEYVTGYETPMGMPCWNRYDGMLLQTTEDGRWVLMQPGAAAVLFSSPHNGAHPTRCAPWVTPDGKPARVTVTYSGNLSRLMDYELVFTVLGTLCNIMGNFLILVIWLGCCGYYVQYKHSTSQTQVTRALPHKLGPFYGAVVSMLVAKLVAMGLVYYRQCKMKVMLLDWETPKGMDRSTNDETPISMWRRVLVANEFHNLSVTRSWHTTWCLVWLMWLYVGLGYDTLAVADPDLTNRHRANWGVPYETSSSSSDVNTYSFQSATHPILRVAITGFIAFFSSLIWFLLNACYHFVLPENPLSRFEDLLAQCNVSILLLPLPRWGYFLNGRKQAPVEGCDNAEMSLVEWQVQQAAISMQPMYIPVKRKFEIFLSKQQGADVRALLDVPIEKHAKTLRREKGTFRRCFERLHGVTVRGTHQHVQTTGVQEARVRTIKENLDKAVSEAVLKFTMAPSSFLGLPPPYPLQPLSFVQAQAQSMAQVPLSDNAIQLYAEPLVNLGPGWASVATLAGADGMLHLSEMVVFIALDSLLEDPWLAILLVMLCYYLGKLVRTRASLLSLSRQAVDPRFLL
eukprot:TRINITY_DN3395_c0_g1_i3.p1 TRINITY_DN3395_c0_g1~~TRINITY_DN3395_c0_g1_i3.p1  ORF type:complete len:1001 (+),score=139.78 TRINITY_DN3395_c0_g1_i3:41-3004(+)